MISFSSLRRSVCLITAAVFTTTLSLQAQMSKDTSFKPHGKLWGVGFGDFAYKADADALKRGGTDQYTGVAAKQSMFQFRRIYLGYDYDISKHFTGNILLAMEDNLVATASGSTTGTGDLLSNGKLSLFIKSASVTWKNICAHTNLSLGQVFTPASTLLPEATWDYRCIERTISELRRTPAWDMGVLLNSTFCNNDKAEAGYNLMIGNGNGSKPENNKYKWFYVDVYAKLLHKKLILDLYADYNRIDAVDGHTRNMLKLLVAYSTTKFTIGAEGFMNTLRKDNHALKTDSTTVLLNTVASDISLYARGRLYKDKVGFFVRYDMFDPSHKLKNSSYLRYNPVTTNYDPNTKETLATAGIDYTPIDKIHIMPNIWYTGFQHAGPGNLADGHDLVYRLSIYYVIGK